jgi:methionyl aminopeptidase
VLSPDKIERMRRACRAARRVLEVTKKAVRPGITTDMLDMIAHAACIAEGAYPSCLNYGGFPKSICTSVNEIICHGIPDSRPLCEGDIVNIDVTLYLDGMHGDCSTMVLVGEVDEEARRLVEVARECLLRGIGAVHSGGRVRDIGKAITKYAHKQGYSVVRAYCGHGINEVFHTDLVIPHNFEPSARDRIRPGAIFTVEPMINQGGWQHRVWDDDWTAVTADGSLSAQFEHTILVTETGVEILTCTEDEEQPFLKA